MTDFEWVKLPKPAPEKEVTLEATPNMIIKGPKGYDYYALVRSTPDPVGETVNHDVPNGKTVKAMEPPAPDTSLQEALTLPEDAELTDINGIGPKRAEPYPDLTPADLPAEKNGLALITDEEFAEAVYGYNDLDT